MRISKLESLAREEVGKTGSPLIFVSRNGDIIAVFAKVRGLVGLDEAISFASKLGEGYEVVVEDSSGVVWENRFSERLQQEDEEE